MPLYSGDMSLGEILRLRRHLAHSVYHTPTSGTVPDLVHGRTIVQVKHGTPLCPLIVWPRLGAEFSHSGLAWQVL